MASVVKWCGMILLFCSCTLAGFRKAAVLQRRVKRLEHADAALEELEQLVRSDGRERAVLLRETLGRHGLLESGKVLLFDPEDRRILQDFLTAFGGGDTETECRRIGLCRALLRQQAKAARKIADERARLYKVTGLCLGTAGCIFWL